MRPKAALHGMESLRKLMYSSSTEALVRMLLDRKIASDTDMTRAAT